MPEMTKEDKSLRKQITDETAEIYWSELQLFFAKGSAILIDNDLDIIEVSFQISKDNKLAIENWMFEGKIKKVPDDVAKEWFASDAKVLSVVVKPWVIVQSAKLSKNVSI